MPFWQVTFELAVWYPGQTFPHAPQFCTVVVLTHWPPQHCSLAPQAANWPHLQVPPLQVSAFRVLQEKPHPLQLLKLVCVSTHCPPQQRWLAPQAASPPHVQFPSWQASAVCASQALPHEPQWMKSVSIGEHVAPSQQSSSCAQVLLPQVQAPLSHVSLARHVWPHVPQLA